MTPLAARAARIEPFHVMEVVKQAEALERAGRSVIHLSIGEPDFTATEPVRRAAALAIEQGRTQYTPALGISRLRERIAEWYATRFGASRRSGGDRGHGGGLGSAAAHLRRTGRAGHRGAHA